MKLNVYKFLISFSCFLITGHLNAQYAKHQHIPDYSQDVRKDFTDRPFQLSTTITAGELKEHIFTLAADEMQGRETGTPGNDKAAEYIKGVFEKMRLPAVGPDGDYNQNVAFTFTSWESLKMKVDGEEYKLMRDFIAFPQFSTDVELKKKQIVFAGYGINSDNYSDYKKLSAEGKILIVYDGEPILNDGTSLVTDSKIPSDWSADWKLKSKAAKENGAEGLLIISNDLKSLINAHRRQLLNRVTQLGDHREPNYDFANTWFISPEFAKVIIGTQRDSIIAMRDHLIMSQVAMTPTVLNSKIKVEQKIDREVLVGQNLLGFVEGGNKKDELVIVSAHYDHVGTKGKEVYNGADDNASGTSAVLELLEAVQTAKLMGHGPRRSILFLLVTGEEKGLLGSEYYAAHPVFPIDKSIADVNIDMVGRKGEDYLLEERPYIYVIGSDRLSDDLHDINEAMNQKYSQLILDYKYNDEEDPNRFYYRSDHYNFAKHGIPSIFFFNGVHEDYHRLTDTPDKIDLELIEARARQIFHTVWELANRDQRIRLNKNIETP